MKQNLKEKQKANVKTTEKQNKGESGEFVSFFREHLKVPFCICAILSIAIILVSVIGMVKNMDITEASFKFQNFL